jgi:hypothetical protein
MTTGRYIYWRDGDQRLGYFEETPDYQTQGESLEGPSGTLEGLVPRSHSDALLRL